MISDKKKQILEFYNQGIALYKERKFKEALDFFKKSHEVDPDDGPTNLYITRCQTYIKNPPAADWDGVFVMTTK